MQISTYNVATRPSLVGSSFFRVNERDSRRIAALSRFYGIHKLRGPLALQFGAEIAEVDYEVVDRSEWSYHYVLVVEPTATTDPLLVERIRTHSSTLVIVDTTDFRLSHPVRDVRLATRQGGRGDCRPFRANAFSIAHQINADILFEEEVWHHDAETGVWKRRPSTTKSELINQIKWLE